jgi:uncharacterized protein HemX
MTALGRVTTLHFRPRTNVRKELDLKLTLSSSIREWDVASPFWEETMNSKKERKTGTSWRNAAVAVLALWMASGGAIVLLAQSSTPTAKGEEKQMTKTQSKFYCNIKALTPAERAHHKQLGEKMSAARREIVETPKGYEFQFSPKDISLAELADWVLEESKCCPFFDFHIDVENEASLLCLRLTGEEGIKEFLRGELGFKK